MLRARGVPVLGFREVGDSADALTAAAELGLPVVLKPVSGSGSVGVRLCRTRAEVVETAGRLLSRRENARELPVVPRALVEQYVSGPEFSVELFDGEVVGVTAKHLGPPPDFVEVGHDFPALLSAPDKAAITGCAKAAVHALGLAWGAVHAELRLSAEGPRIIEVNPRLAGGMIPDLVLAAYGVDLVDCVVAKACGDLPKLGRLREEHAAIRFLLALRDGEITEIGGVDAARACRAVRSVAVTVEPGDRIVLTRSFKDRVGAVITADRSAAVATAQADTALGLLAVRMRDHDDEDRT